MKRIDLEKKLRIAGCYLKREGISHSLWINPKTGVVEAVPRHKEIKEFIDILNSLEKASIIESANDWKS